MFKKVLGAVICFSILACCKTFGAMEALTDDVMIRSEILGGVDWKSVYDSTKEKASHSTSTSAAYGGGSEIKWMEVKEDALKGSPVAQFCMYKYLYQMSEKYTNGTQEELKYNGLMFLLISHVKGHLEKSKGEFTYRHTQKFDELSRGSGLTGNTSEVVERLNEVIRDMLKDE